MCETSEPAPPQHHPLPSDLEELIEASGLVHVLRVTNLIRKAHCLLAKERWEDGRRVDTRQHAQGAAARRLPFLLLRGHRLELLEIVALLRPVLVAKGLVREPRARRRAAAARRGAEGSGGGWGEGDSEEGESEEGEGEEGSGSEEDESEEGTSWPL
jgi:hypothetical protein